MKRTNPVIIIAAALGAAACVAGPAEQVVPAEQQTYVRPQGYTAAAYEIQTRTGVLGEARVYSSGAYRATVDGQTRTVVQVGFTIDNNADRAMMLQDIRLESADVGEQILRDLPPAVIETPKRIAAGGQRQVETYFVLPPGTEPQDVDAFRVGWRLRTDGLSYSQRTPFVEYERSYYYTPYYDPFYYSYADPYVRPALSVNRGPFQHYHFF